MGGSGLVPQPSPHFDGGHRGAHGGWQASTAPEAAFPLRSWVGGRPESDASVNGRVSAAHRRPRTGAASHALTLQPIVFVFYLGFTPLSVL